MVARVLAVLSVVWSGMGCAGTVLVRRNDPTFARSVKRLRTTRQLVEAAHAAPEEQEMFNLAESLYRYRFETPPRNFGSYVAQVGAVVLELPALQALAGSLDLFELRLRACDGAVQIWETLLSRYPHSRLRPLALYRLGWAYRNTISPGFPRDDPAQPHRELIAHEPTSSLSAFAREALRVPYKSPGTATSWSILPGAGQLYAGEVGSGLTRLGIAVAAAAMIAVPAVVAYQRRDSLGWGDWPLLAIGVSGAIILSVDYTLAYQDALRAVMEYNERYERKFEDAFPNAP